MSLVISEDVICYSIGSYADRQNVGGCVGTFSAKFQCNVITGWKLLMKKVRSSKEAEATLNQVDVYVC